MIIRTVRMIFIPEKTEQFLTLFEQVAPAIRRFPGCHHLELWQDTRFSNIFTTYSHWISNEALQRYRESALFKQTWQDTRKLFAAPPVAHSYRLKVKIDAN